MSMQRGLTTWVWQNGAVSVAYRWNMDPLTAMRTFKLMRGPRHLLCWGPFMVEW